MFRFFSDTLNTVIFRFNQLIKGTHCLLKKKKNSQLKTKCEKLAEDVKNRRIDRFHIGGADEAKKDAKSGYWSKNKNKKKPEKGKKNIFDKGYKLHVQREKNKNNWRDDQIVVLRDISHSINYMAMTERQMFADCKEYVRSQYEPAEHRADVIKIVRDNQEEFVDLWSVVIRQRYNDEQKKESFQRLIDEFK